MADLLCISLMINNTVSSGLLHSDCSCISPFAYHLLAFISSLLLGLVGSVFHILRFSFFLFLGGAAKCFVMFSLVVIEMFVCSLVFLSVPFDEKLA